MTTRPLDLFVERTGPGGVPVHLLSTDRFRGVLFSCCYEYPLDTGSAARALLADLLTRGTRRHPGLAALAARCEELFATELVSGASGHGDRQVLRFGFESVSDRAVKQPLFLQTAELLAEVLNDPPLVDGAFSAESLEQERENLVHSIEALGDDKAALAYRRMLECLHAGSEFARHGWGTAAEAAALDEPGVRAVWEDLRLRAPVRVFAVGDLAEDQVLDAVGRVLGSGPRRPWRAPITPPPIPSRAPQRVVDVAALAQSKLVMGFRLDPAVLAGPGAALFALVFGGDSWSRLFKRVREAESLAYGCHASISVESGTLVVQAGIDADAAERVIALVLAELQALAAHGVTAEELELARRTQLRRLLNLCDHPGSLAGFRNAALLAGRPHVLDDVVAAVQAARPEALAAVAATARLDTTFLLEGRGERSASGQVPAGAARRERTWN